MQRVTIHQVEACNYLSRAITPDAKSDTEIKKKMYNSNLSFSQHEMHLSNRTIHKSGLWRHTYGQICSMAVNVRLYHMIQNIGLKLPNIRRILNILWTERKTKRSYARKTDHCSVLFTTDHRNSLFIHG